MRILANDGLSQEGIDVIKNAGIELDTHHIPQEELFEKLNNYDAIIVRSATTVRKDLIDATKLKVIGRAGVGMDNIDVAYAREKGIAVVNTPGASSISVAELVFAHLFSLCRYTHRSTHAMENGEWPKKDYTGIELTGKTIGLIGYGNIAKEVAKRAITDVKEGNLKKFTSKMKEIAKIKLAKADLRPKLEIEAELGLEEVSQNLVKDIASFSPFGQDNPRPKFISQQAQIKDIINMGIDGQHIKFRFNGLWALAFGRSEEWKDFKIGDRVDIVYYVENNNFNGRSEVQLKLIDIRNVTLI